MGIDVCNDEYNSAELPGDPLIGESTRNSNVIVTPHAGGATIDAHAKVFGKIADLIENYLVKESNL